MMRLTLISVLALISCKLAIPQTTTQISSKAPASIPGFDLGRLLGGRGGEPIWTLLDRNLPQVQKLIDTTKQRCLQQLQMPAAQRSLIREQNPNDKEKCLVECVLKGIKIMDANNRLNLRTVEQLTSLVTDDNKIAIALSCSLAQSCNRAVTTSKPCEAAHQLNQCIGRQLERNKVKLNW